MKKPTKRLLMGFLIAFVVGFALLNILAYNHAHAMMYFTSGGTRTEKPEKLTLGQRIKVLLTGVNVPRPVSSRQPSELDFGCRRLTIRGTNGITLGCWYVDRGEKTPLVILFHGYGAEKTCLIREAKVFLQLGMSVLLVDFRGSGESSESYTTIGFREADDVTTVMQHARLNLRHPSVVLYGQSMGAVSILRAVHRCQGTDILKAQYSEAGRIVQAHQSFFCGTEAIQSYSCVRSPSRSFSAMRSRRLFGASTFTSGIHDRIHRTSSLRPVVSSRISTRPSACV